MSEINQENLLRLKNLITEKQISADNVTGISITYLINELDFPLSEIKSLLHNLWNDKYIIVRKGINTDLIFLKEYVRERI